jgi:hypothetical protein
MNMHLANHTLYVKENEYALSFEHNGKMLWLTAVAYRKVPLSDALYVACQMQVGKQMLASNFSCDELELGDSFDKAVTQFKEALFRLGVM